DERSTRIRAFMAIAKDEQSVGKADARSGQWVDITMKKDYLNRKMENLNEVRVNELRSDNGTEFRNYKMEEFFDEKGISQNFSSPCTPEQNGVAERRNRTLIEAARTISIIAKRNRNTAYDVFRGRSDISYFHVFGCFVYIHNHMDHLGKFDEKADDGFFLGYSPIAKAFRVFNIRRQEMEEIVHVTFNEDDEAISQSNTEATQCSGNIEYFPYIHAYENITPADLLIPQDSVSTEDPPEFTEADDHPAFNELDQLKLADIIESTKTQNVIIEPISDTQSLPTTISPSVEIILQTLFSLRQMVKRKAH
ncbi:retrovirus-related pol polyprotein from transposon TNT 1-94, partial [Tanacetum coccineum]